MVDCVFNEDYVRKLANADPETVKHFITHFSGLLRIKLRSKLRSPQMIEDVRQETFLRVLQSVHKSDGLQKPERLGAFVNSVCNHVLLEAFRAGLRHPPVGDDIPDLIDEGADPSQRIVTEERKKLVSAVLAELPGKDRELLRQVFFEERDKELICKEMNVNQEYLRVLIHRAKERFRTSFEKSGGVRL